MKRKYEEIDVLNRTQLDSIQVGDLYIQNNMNMYRMRVSAVTKDFIVGTRFEGAEMSAYSLITKEIDGYTHGYYDIDGSVHETATDNYPHVGPDSYYCLGYKTDEEAQLTLDHIQEYYDKRKEDVKLHKHTVVEWVNPRGFKKEISQDPRSRYTIDLKKLKVLRHQ